MSTARGAFTVVELLVAIGVLALVAVGTSVIFGSIGDAVSNGRKASELNRAATRIEQGIREDIEAMTRDGFLVLVNQYASDETGNPVDVRVSRRSTGQRERRTDELMFFARGDFQTARRALVDGMVARSSEAAIYYGLGQRGRPDLSNPNSTLNSFFFPSPDDDNIDPDALLGVTAPPGQVPNPNEFARDWTLLRQVTLLAQPNRFRVLPQSVFGIERGTQIQSGRRLLEDSDRQIALQPAARTIFGSAAWTDRVRVQGQPGVVPFGQASAWSIRDDARFFQGAPVSLTQRFRPARRSSGVVDIVQGSIRSIRTQLQALPATSLRPQDFSAPGGNNAVRTWDFFETDFRDTTQSPRPSDALTLDLSNAGQTVQRQSLVRWSLDMLPSVWDTRTSPPTRVAGVRYEEIPTRLVYEDADFPQSSQGRLGRAIAETDQEMLGASVFVPRCTEFIVEWSYGFRDQSLNNVNDPDFKKLLWHGLPRAIEDDNNDGVVDLVDHGNVAEITRYEPRPAPAGDADPERRLVAPWETPLNDLTLPEMQVFGIVDPRGSAAVDGGTVSNRVDDDIVVPWPKFLRVTMTLADPEDETLEQTYQFVIRVRSEQG